LRILLNTQKALRLTSNIFGWITSCAIVFQSDTLSAKYTGALIWMVQATLD